MPIHGNVITNSKINPNLIAEWNIKNNIQCCVIGIHSTYTLETYFKKDYGWNGAGGHEEYFSSGDTIKMELNIPMKQLKYYKNANLSGVVYNDI